MKIAFLYSGQGSQYVGMGKNFYDNCSAFRNVMNQISLSFDVKEACFEDRNRILDKTQYTQPCIVAYQIALTETLLHFSIYPQYTAGISLGEYSALYAAGVWNMEEVFNIVSYRGRIMEECVRGIPCLTASIIGLSNECVKEICNISSNGGIVQITNYCCPGNVSIGGNKKQVEEAMRRAQIAGAKYCIPLRSCYPFHTTLLSEAGEKMCEYLKTVNAMEMKSTVVFNYTGRAKRENETLGELLKMQIQSCVQFEKSIRFLEKEEVDTIIDLGPGDMVSRLAKRILHNAKIYTIQEPADVEKLACIVNETV